MKAKTCFILMGIKDLKPMLIFSPTSEILLLFKTVRREKERPRPKLWWTISKKSYRPSKIPFSRHCSMKFALITKEQTMEFGGLKTNTDKKEGMFIWPNNIFVIWCVYTNYIPVFKMLWCRYTHTKLVYTYIFLLWIVHISKKHKIQRIYIISNSECMTNNL